MIDDRREDAHERNISAASGMKKFHSSDGALYQPDDLCGCRLFDWIKPILGKRQ